MTAASKSLYYFGFYLLITGVTLTVVPNMLLSVFQIALATEVWIRVLGVVVFNVGLFYVFMAPTNNVLFLNLSVYARLCILVWFSIFVIIGLAPMQLLIFGLTDGAGAAWTYLTLRKKT
jgi:hypothetical protein